MSVLDNSVRAWIYFSLKINIQVGYTILMLICVNYVTGWVDTFDDLIALSPFPSLIPSMKDCGYTQGFCDIWAECKS